MSELTEEEKMELRRKRLKEKVKQKKKEKKQRKKAEKIEHNEQDSQKKPLTFDLGTMFDKLLQVDTVVLVHCMELYIVKYHYLH